MEKLPKNSSLSLLSSYGDDDEDEEEEITHEKYNTNCVHKGGEDLLVSDSSRTTLCNRLPLPSTILQLYKDSPSTDCPPEENPDLHDGRVRSFPHQRGNWATYVYVPYEPKEGFQSLLTAFRSSAAHVGVDLKPVPDPHISVTRTVVLLHHWIDSFVSSAKSKFSRRPCFFMDLGFPAVYCNEEGTRTFLGLKVATNTSHLRDAVELLDQSLAEFRLPPFYKDPEFHLSVLWVVGDKRSALEALLPQFHAEFDSHAVAFPDEFSFTVKQFLCKTGNKTFSFPLLLY